MGKAVMQLDHADVLWPHPCLLIHGAGGTLGHVGTDKAGHGLGLERFHRVGHKRLPEDRHVAAQAMFACKGR
ncbi:hypothetical protein D3C76_1801510 [compost metagenome]